MKIAKIKAKLTKEVIPTEQLKAVKGGRKARPIYSPSSGIKR